MEPNKLETQFKTKLDAREIKPSDMAWDRLDAMLTVAEKPKRNNNWMYIAASFLGFIFIATVFLSQTKTVSDKEKVVFGKEKNLKNQKDLKNQKNINVLNNPNQFSTSTTSVGLGEASIINQKTNQKNQKVSKNLNEKNNQNQNVEKLVINQKTEQINKKNKKDLINLNELNNQNQLAGNDRVGQKTGTPLDLTNKNTENEVNQIVETVKLDKKDEAILANLTPKLMDNNKIKINPNDLLSQVDGELELTFREKIIQSVTKNYKSVKVALENRNK